MTSSITKLREAVEAGGGGVDFRQRAIDMHRRAQRAEGRIQRALWWLEAGMKEARETAEKRRYWPGSVPRFYLEEALAALEAQEADQ